MSRKRRVRVAEGWKVVKMGVDDLNAVRFTQICHLYTCCDRQQGVEKGGENGDGLSRRLGLGGGFVGVFVRIRSELKGYQNGQSCDQRDEEVSHNPSLIT